MLNHIVIMGRLTRDPELRRTPAGTAVCSFTVAVDRDFQSRDGGEKQTDFIDCVAWEQRAEFVSKWFTKGRMIIVEGRLESRKWQDKMGQNRVSWQIRSDRIHFGETRREAYGDNPPPYGSAPGYGNSSGYGSASASGYGNAPAPGYGNSSGYDDAPAPDYGGGSGFSEIGDDEDGDLPF